MKIEDWRIRIDELNAQILELLGQVSAATSKTCRTKKLPPINALEKKKFLNEMGKLSSGPLSSESTKTIFRTIVAKTNCVKIDQKMLRLNALLNDRAKCAVAIGEIKKQCGLPVLDSAREKAVLERVGKMAKGVFSVKSSKTIFRNIMAETRKVED